MTHVIHDYVVDITYHAIFDQINSEATQKSFSFQTDTNQKLAWLGTVSYSQFIVTMVISLAVYDISSVKE